MQYHSPDPLVMRHCAYSMHPSPIRCARFRQPASKLLHVCIIKWSKVNGNTAMAQQAAVTPTCWNPTELTSTMSASNVMAWPPNSHSYFDAIKLNRIFCPFPITTRSHMPKPPGATFPGWHRYIPQGSNMCLVQTTSPADRIHKEMPASCCWENRCSNTQASPIATAHAPQQQHY